MALQIWSENLFFIKDDQQNPWTFKTEWINDKDDNHCQLQRGSSEGANRSSIKWKDNDMLLRLISVLCKILIVERKKVITPKTIANLDSHLPGYTQVFIPSLNVYRYPRYVSVLPVSFYDFSGLWPFYFWHVLYLQQVSLTFKQKNSFLLTRLKKSCSIQRGMVRW